MEFCVVQLLPGMEPALECGWYIYVVYVVYLIECGNVDWQGRNGDGLQGMVEGLPIEK